MATINGIYIFVESESLNRDVNITSHAVEQGVDLTDNVKRNPYTISLSGKIVGSNSAINQSKIAAYMANGTLVSYSGRNYINNALITKFETSHPNTVNGGCEFSMEISEVRIAKSNVVSDVKTAAVQKGGTQQVEENNSSNGVYHEVKKGDMVYNLVASANAPYKKYGKSCQWVMDNNPDAFAVKGDFGSLKVGAKLLVGYKDTEA
jgi:hypothetical protein